MDIAALRSGNYAELVNLVPWKVNDVVCKFSMFRWLLSFILLTPLNIAQGIELLLKHVHAAGVYGWGNVCDIILGQWLEDVSQNQVSIF